MGANEQYPDIEIDDWRIEKDYVYFTVKVTVDPDYNVSRNETSFEIHVASRYIVEGLY